MEEKKLTDEAVNATVKSLKWVCNQIPNDLGDSNEEKMLKCIQLYCEQGIALINRLQDENERLTGTVKVLEFADRCGRRMRALDMKENAELQKRLDDLSTEENDGFLFFSQRMKLGEICEAYFKEHRILNCAQSVIGHLIRLGLLNIPKTKQYLQEQSNEKKK